MCLYLWHSCGLSKDTAQFDLSWPHTSTSNYIWDFLSFCVLVQGAEDELKHAVAFVRPVSVAFEVVNGFRSYKKGVYTSDTCGSTPLVSILQQNTWSLSV